MNLAALVERARSAGDRARGWLLAAAVVLFVGTAVVAFRSLPDGLEVRWWPIVVSAVLVSPLSTLVNAAEFAATARVLGAPVERREAMRVAVLSSAANLLPVPGAVAVRTVRLREAAGYRRSFAVTAGAGVCWLGTALLAAGLADAVVNQRAGALIPVAAGAAALAAAAIVIRRAALGDDGRRAWWLVFASEVGQVAVGAARLALAVAALDVPVTVAQGLGLAVAPVAASAVGVFPGGLGLREGLAASFAALVDLPAAVGAAAAAVDRVLGLVVVAVLAAVLGSGGTRPLRSDRVRSTREGTTR